MELLQEIARLKVNSSIASSDLMYDGNIEHYWYAGRSALLCIINTINARLAYPGGASRLRNVLDFGCGYGRVTRWLSVAFPATTVYVTDSDASAVEWCAENLDGKGITEDLPRAFFDLIWLGSVLPHLPAPFAEALLANLIAALRPSGVIVFTSQGRFSVARMRTFDWENDRRWWLHYGLDRDRFESMVAAYHATGYGYIDYPGQIDYGVCVASPSWYSERVLGEDVVQIFFQEKGWDNHQDVIAFMRTGLLDEQKAEI
jgi:SAM-dependent methyltransferase